MAPGQFLSAPILVLETDASNPSQDLIPKPCHRKASALPLSDASVTTVAGDNGLRRAAGDDPCPRPSVNVNRNHGESHYC